MSFEQLSDLEMAAVERRLGSVLVRLPLIARRGGHKRPIGTFLDYVHALGSVEQRLAVEYGHDLLRSGATTEAVLTKWYPHMRNGFDIALAAEGRIPLGIR